MSCAAADRPAHRIFPIGSGKKTLHHIRASGHSGCIAMEVTPSCKNRPDTWLHPNASQKARFLLHRGRRPYMALRVVRDLVACREKQTFICICTNAERLGSL